MTDIYCKIENHNSNPRTCGGYIYLSDFEPVGLHRNIAGRIDSDLRFDKLCKKNKINNKNYKENKKYK